jgi:hypothetical protein
VTSTPTSSDSGGGGGQAGGSESGEVEITDTTLLNESTTTGDEVVVRVDLANFDPVRGTISLALDAGGSTVTERSLAVGASTRRTVYLRHRFDRAGRHALSVNGEPVGSVVVSESATPTTAPTAAPTATAPPRTATSGPTATTEPSTADAPEAQLRFSSDNATEADDLTKVPRTTSTDGAGFGPIALLVAVGALVLLGRRD